MKGRIIGFDFGLKRIGIATGNRATSSAQSLGIISAKDGHPDWAAIEKLIADWKPDQLVVGLPLLLDGSEGDMVKRVRGFGQTLEKLVELPVAWVDERLTSSEADYLLRQTTEQGKSIRKKMKNNRDGLAAELIIKTYLNDNRAPL